MDIDDLGDRADEAFAAEGWSAYGPGRLLPVGHALAEGDGIVVRLLQRGEDRSSVQWLPWSLLEDTEPTSATFRN